MVDNFAELLEIDLEKRGDPLKLDPSQVECSKGKKPGSKKIKEFCQPMGCKHLASKKVLDAKMGK